MASAPAAAEGLERLERREQELLARDEELEARRQQALAEPVTSGSPDAAAPAHKRLPRPPSRTQLADRGDEDRGVAATAARGSSEAFAQAAGDGPESLATTVRLQGARIAALQQELDRTIQELAGRDSDNRQLKQDLRQLTEESARLQRRASCQAEEGALDRLKKQLAASEARTKELEGERAELHKAKDQGELQLKKASSEGSGREARLSRATEENERLRQQLKELGSQDKDRAAGDRRELDRLQAEVRKLERQRTELVGAFKKQMKLIDVLKRQRAHMEAARVLSFTEDEFIRALELGERLGE